jgi:hypothetical protein
MAPSSGDFAGTERFQILRRLGSGGMGVVYAARDLERGAMVALKTLRWTDPTAIYRLKKEFRVLADVAHPNLVTLYELVAHEDAWFFTMELVDGVRLDDYLCTQPLDVGRLRGVLRQVAEGLSAIHAAGLLHRDLKPSNVLVASSGRAVILDFGIADAALGEGAAGPRTIEAGLGTVEYMAPEQFGGPAAATSDWYALGVLLYEVLTRRLPYAGSPYAIIARKQAEDPPRPDTIAAGLPPDLVTLCLRLLARDPAARPRGEDVVRFLGGTAIPRRTGGRLVARDAHLAQLDEAMKDTERGCAVSLYVHGASGIGKTTLVQHFVDSLVRANRAVVLVGRAYARESVPYKGLDAVIDSLTRYLRTLGDAEVQQLITPDVFALARLFPVVERVEAIARLPYHAQEILDPVEVRRRAFAALRSLLGRIRTHRAVVVWIDDLQWSDADSAVLLEDLTGPPEAPPILLIASFRSEEIASHPFLGALLHRVGGASSREIRVDALANDETRDLARSLLGVTPAEQDAVVEAIVRDSAGSPFLVEQLTRYVTTHGGAGVEGPRASLAQVLDARIAQFPERARAFLETLTVAAGPIDSAVARSVAGLSGDERPLVALLQAEHLLRVSSSPAQVELYHDRIRETLAADIPPERTRTLHLHLAQSMLAHGRHDPEALYEHYLAAGERAQAAPYATQAGDKATAALAFDRAAGFYQRALDLLAPEDAEVSSLRVRLGDALANAGRGAEAANAYVAAAERAGGTAALDLRRRAAEQLIRCGHIDQGLGVLDSVLAPLNLKLARSPRHALLRVLWRRAWIRLRGLRFTERLAVNLDPLTLMRLDACWTVGVGLSRVDNIRAADFQALHLILALRAGEPYRVARALAGQGLFVSLAGGPAAQRAAALVRRARELARRVGHPYLSALAELAEGFGLHAVGRFAEALPPLDAAERIFREQCTGVVWELNSTQMFASYALWFLGELVELKRRVPLRLREARERGDLHAVMDVAAGRPNVTWLVSDDATTARQVLHDAMRPWSTTAFHLQHFYSLLAEEQIDLYRDEARAAWERIRAQWPALARSLLLRIQLVRNEALHLRARCALALAVQTGGSEQQDYLAIAERDARRIARDRMRWSDPLADLLSAAIQSCRGDRDAAVGQLRRAVERFVVADMACYAAVARRRLGQLLGGVEGAQLIADADGWMRGQQVVRPERITTMLAPGFP